LQKTSPRVMQPGRVSDAPTEFAIDESTYHGILALIENMALTMERNPTFFRKASETNVRDILLVTLNSIYQGAATGETFSNCGKTDVQIIHEGRSIFIAELKFWKGPKSLLDSAEQLLNYLSWRDTCTAIVLLNKKKDFSAVLDQVVPTLQSHSCFKSFVRQHGVSNFEFVFNQKSDRSRLLQLTVLAFDLAGLLTHPEEIA